MLIINVIVARPTKSVKGGTVRRYLLLAVCLVLPVCAAAQTEVALTGGVNDSYNMGQNGAVPTAEARAIASVGRWDVTANIAWRGMSKIGTPRGHQTTDGLGLRRWVSSDVFVLGRVDWVFADSTVWTKTVAFGGVGVGICARYGTGRRPQRDVLSMWYEWELSSSMPQCANRTHGPVFQWQHDFPLRGNWFLRGDLRFDHVYYRQSGAWRSGDVNALNVGIAWRPRD